MSSPRTGILSLIWYDLGQNLDVLCVRQTNQLLLEYVGLPHVLDLSVHLVIFLAG